MLILQNRWMPADSLWSFCIALSVYLTFYKKYTTTQLKNLEWKYCLACYGMPLIPSVTLLCVNGKERGKIYGPAIVYQGTRSSNLFSGWFLNSYGVRLTLIGSFYVFCVSMDQCGMSLASKKWTDFYFYRLVIIGTFTIYIVIGRDIFQHHRTLRSFAGPLPNPHAGLNPHRDTNAIILEAVGGVSKSNFSHLEEQNYAKEHLSSARPFSQNSTNTDSAAQYQPRRVSTVECTTNSTLWYYLGCSLLFFITLVVTWVWVCPLFQSWETLSLTTNCRSQQASIGSTASPTLIARTMAWTSLGPSSYPSKGFGTLFFTL
jgi:hypothetical protein